MEQIDRFSRMLPTEEELTLFREAYSETYPVRPLMNEIDRLRAALAEVMREAVENKDAFACMYVARKALGRLDVRDFGARPADSAGDEHG